MQHIGQGLTVCSDFSADIADSCPMRHEVEGSDFAAFRFGEVSACIEMSFTAEALRKFLKLGAEALSKLEAQFAYEEAEYTRTQQAMQAHGLVTIGEQPA